MGDTEMVDAQVSIVADNRSAADSLNYDDASENFASDPILPTPVADEESTVSTGTADGANAISQVTNIDFGKFNDREVKQEALKPASHGVTATRSSECDYYVLCYMMDVMDDTNVLTNNFFGKLSYDQSEIDVVREEWAAHVSNVISLAADEAFLGRGS